jgi:hypothetical protein
VNRMPVPPTVARRETAPNNPPAKITFIIPQKHQPTRH